jgi:ferredoxin-fold anticodon binding domain-containing protein
MSYQHVENLLIRYRGQAVNLKTVSGGVYEGTVTDVTNDYVALKEVGGTGEADTVVVLLHNIEAILPRTGG